MSAQSYDALQLANEARKVRAAFKRDIFEGRVSVRDVLLEVPAHRGRKMAISDVLAAQLNWGPCRALRMLRSAGIPESKPLGDLTDRQRFLLWERLA